MSAKTRLEKRRNDCYARCNSRFVNQPELIPSCKDACYANDSITIEQFLCSGNYLSEFDFIAKYGYDPCPNSGYTVEQVMQAIKAGKPQPPGPPPPKMPDNDSGAGTGANGAGTTGGGTQQNSGSSGNTKNTIFIILGGGLLVLLVVIFVLKGR